jgi:prepilin-type processing-associated H-X9-DG protein
MDRQAPRIAYGGNAAIFPRNKFTLALSGGQRKNVLVNETEVHDPGRVILVAEFTNNWKAIGIPQGGGILSKSHRPMNPFWHTSSGSSEYQAGFDSEGFTYGDPPYYGLMSKDEVEQQISLIDSPGIIETNAVGRHHPGGSDAYIGGAANFLYADGHMEKKSVLETVKNHEWGNRYYSIDGHNKVGPPWD